jgi:tRNA threonylcarbamoyladenosine biosynthesis protein TsaB
VLVLALDTTTRAGSVAVARDLEILAVVEGDASRTHGERLPGEIAAALDRASIAAGDVDLLVVASGPGAFTGLRIGLAAIQGLAMVLNTPVVGISALDAWADTARVELDVEDALVVWMDAQRGEVFSACYRVDVSSSDAQTFRPVAPAVVGTPAAILNDLPLALKDRVTFVGDGAVRHAAIVEAARGHAARIVAGLPPLAPALARLGRSVAASGGAGPPHALAPLYIRRPDAELDRERQGEP